MVNLSRCCKPFRTHKKPVLKKKSKTKKKLRKNNSGKLKKTWDRDNYYVEEDYYLEEDYYDDFIKLIYDINYNLDDYLDLLDCININNKIEVKYGEQLINIFLQKLKDFPIDIQREYTWKLIELDNKKIKDARFIFCDGSWIANILHLIKYKYQLSYDDYILLIKDDWGNFQSDVVWGWSGCGVLGGIPEKVWNDPQFVLKLKKDFPEFDDFYSIPDNLFGDVNFSRQFYRMYVKQIKEQTLLGIIDYDVKPDVLTYDYLHLEIICEFPELNWDISRLLKKFTVIEIQRALPQLEILSEIDNFKTISREIVITCVLIQNNNRKWLSDDLLNGLQLEEIKKQKPLNCKETGILNYILDKKIPFNNYYHNMLEFVYKPIYLYDLSGDLFVVKDWFFADDIYEVIALQHPELGNIILNYQDIIITQKNQNIIRENTINVLDEVIAEIFYHE